MPIFEMALHTLHHEGTCETTNSHPYVQSGIGNKSEFKSDNSVGYGLKNLNNINHYYNYFLLSFNRYDLF